MKCDKNLNINLFKKSVVQRLLPSHLYSVASDYFLHVGFKVICLLCLLTLFLPAPAQKGKKQQQQPDATTFVAGDTWKADNGNGTFTNPLFYDEFSDPDLIRVGEDYYLTGTTMHAMPGLPVLHSKDLVNWEFLTYACPKLDFGPGYRLQEGKDIYGQGIWAPAIRYHNGTFYIFTNINGQTTQLFTATNPKGPWKQKALKRSFHDLSVLFDDDGKVYVIWGYQELHMAELTDDLTDAKPGTEKIIVQRGSGAGEGCHFYKINGKYYITNTNYDPLCYQVCLRAGKPEGPYEVNVMSAEENLGVGTGWRLGDTRNGKFQLIPPVPNYVGCVPMHQGGIVQLPNGDWWGWSMMDYNSVGRVTCLSPVTWKDEWPYFGLPGNLTRSPRTWVKPNTGNTSQPMATYRRSDDFSASTFQPVWQWNHVPDSTHFSLTERKGYLRLHSLPATSFWNARNSLTQRAMGPESYATSELDVAGIKSGDIAGLALLNFPYAWISVGKSGDRMMIKTFNQQNGNADSAAIFDKKLWLRAYCNFDNDKALFSYSINGKDFLPLGDTVIMPYQLRTFQGIRYALFNFNTSGAAGGYVDFNDCIVNEPRNKGLTQPIPYNQNITLISLADSTVLVNWNNTLRPVSANDRLAAGKSAQFRVLDRGQGRIALQSVVTNGFVTAEGAGGMAQVRIEKEESDEASLFQWQDMLKGDLMLQSLATHRYLFADPYARSLASADAPGTRPDRKDGACFVWKVVSE